MCVFCHSAGELCEAGEPGALLCVCVCVASQSFLSLIDQMPYLICVCFVSRLGNFVKLVDQMVVEHLFHITKTQVLAFTDTVLAIGPLAPRDGFFKANLVFNKQGEATL